MIEFFQRGLFKAGVFARDKGKCVNCGLPGVDAHHIIERRLFPDGGYVVDNGACLCEKCHLAAESTLIGCDTLRQAAGITTVVLPPHFFADAEYDKWGNTILANGLRMRGELFEDEGARKALYPVLHLFTKRIKYPRTFHFPWSPNLQNDDRMLKSTEGWEGREVIITEKMDGEGTTLYNDGLHARSMEFEPHPSRDRIKAIWSEIGWQIPETYRICGENMTAVHSIRYDHLKAYFLVFNIWDGLQCLSWDATKEWSELLGLKTVPEIYKGPYSDDLCRELCDQIDPVTQEGLVVRPTAAFHMREYASVVGKCVRVRHVTTDQHWMRSGVQYNGLER